MTETSPLVATAIVALVPELARSSLLAVFIAFAVWCVLPAAALTADGLARRARVLFWGVLASIVWGHAPRRMPRWTVNAEWAIDAYTAGLASFVPLAALAVILHRFAHGASGRHHRAMRLHRAGAAGCGACGYPSRDGTGGRCPECGWSPEDPAPRSALVDAHVPINACLLVYGLCHATTAMLGSGILDGPALAVSCLLTILAVPFVLLFVDLTPFGRSIVVRLRRSIARGEPDTPRTTG